MATVTIEKQAEGKIYKFYLDSLEFLRITDLGDKYEDFTQFYCRIKDLINPNTHFTTLKKLGPALLYLFLKTRGILLILPDFLDLYQVKYHEFTTSLKKVLKLYPEFNKRDKKVIIKKFMRTILGSFKVKQRIHSRSLTLFDHFYPLIQHTKEEIVAAVICTLTTISFDLKDISMRLICRRAGIPQSSLRNSIMGKIYPYLNIPSNFALKSSFEIIKRKISKKTSLEGIKTKTIEEEIEDLWSIGLSIGKIAELIGLTNPQIMEILENKIGDFRNYRVRYKITEQEIKKACQLKKKGFSFRETATRIHRPLHLVKKMVEENLVDYSQYKYVQKKNRVKPNPSVTIDIYNNPKLVGQFLSGLLEKIRLERSQKIPLNKLDYLLLYNEDSIKKNISKACLYLSKAKIYRAKKTLLGLVLALSFPKIPHLQLANLIGISSSAVKSNLTIKNLIVGDVTKHLDLVVKERINLESIFDYLEIIIETIKKEKIPQVRSITLAKVLDKTQQIKENARDLTMKLRKNGVYHDEGLILSTAIYLSCPYLNKITIKQIITGSIHRKIKIEQVEGILKEINHQGVYHYKTPSVVELLGAVIEEQETDVLCANCGKFVYLQIYAGNKKIFACKHCLIQ